MKLNPLRIIERLIEEHGSSAIQGKHLSLLKDQIAILQRNTTELEAKIEQLETENRQLKSQLQHLQSAPGDKCPYCNQQTGMLEDLKPHPQSLLAQMGTKIGFYKCSNPQCGKSYDRQVRQ